MWDSLYEEQRKKEKEEKKNEPVPVPEPAPEPAPEPDKYDYRTLTPEDRDESRDMLAHAMCTEPTCNDVTNPDMKPSVEDWLEFLEPWMDHCIGNSSYGVWDLQENKIVGVCLVRTTLSDDFIATYDARDKKNKQSKKKLIPWFDYRRFNDHEDFNRKLGSKELWMIGVHPDHRGKKLSNWLIHRVLWSIERIGSRTFHHDCKWDACRQVTMSSTNAFASKAAQLHGFKKVEDKKASTWKDFWGRWKGLYQDVKEPHGTCTWWKIDITDGMFVK